MAVDAPGGLADVHGEVTRPLDLGDDPQRRHQPPGRWRPAPGGREPRSSGPPTRGPALSASSSAMIRYSAPSSSWREEDLGRPGNRLGHASGQLGRVLADLVEGVVEHGAEVLVLLGFLDNGVVTHQTSPFTRIFRSRIARFRESSGLEDLHRRVELDQAAGPTVAVGIDLGGEEGRAVARSGGLLHVMGDDDDRVIRA